MGKTSYDDLMAGIRKPQQPEPPAAGAPVAEAREPVRTAKRGRPPGKRSNPAFRPTTVFLRKQTLKKANHLLDESEARQDLSELIEQLLGQWIQQRPQ